MRLIAAIVAAVIVVISVALDSPLFLKGIAKGKGLIDIPGSIEAGGRLTPGGIRPQAKAEGILAICCYIGIGVIEIIENKAFICQLIEGRRQFFIDGCRSKAFCADGNQIVILQHAGIFVLLGRRKGLHIGIELFKSLASGRGIELIKINFQHVVAVFHLLRFCRNRSILRILGRFLSRLNNGFKIQLNIHSGFSSFSLLAATKELQTHGSQKAETLCSLVGGGGITVVEIVVGIVTCTADPQRQQCDNLHNGRQADDRCPEPIPPHMKGPLFLQEHSCERNGQQHQQQNRDILHNGQECFFPEAGQRRTAHADQRHGIHGAKHRVIHNLAAVHDRKQAHQNHGYDLVGLHGKKAQQKGDHQTKCSSKAQGIQAGCRAFLKQLHMQHDLHVQQNQNPKQSVANCAAYKPGASMPGKKLFQKVPYIQQLTTLTNTQHIIAYFVKNAMTFTEYS